MFCGFGERTGRNLNLPYALSHDSLPLKNNQTFKISVKLWSRGQGKLLN